MSVETAAERAARVIQTDESMSAVRATARDAHESVVLESDAYGTITDLQIADSAMNLDPARLARIITACHRKARENAEAEAARLLTRLAATRDRPPPARSVPASGQPHTRVLLKHGD